jgi:uncharacterized protein YcbK (DUF882 family)
MLPDGKYFKAFDFRCHNGTPYPESWYRQYLDTRDLADATRDAWGGPLIVVSGYRTPEFNQGLIEKDKGKGVHGVASGSNHVKGEALDLRTNALTCAADIPALKRIVLQAWEDNRVFVNVDGSKRLYRDLLGGLGCYFRSGWIHVDTAKATDGHLRRWEQK